MSEVHVMDHPLIQHKTAISAERMSEQKNSER